MDRVCAVVAGRRGTTSDGGAPLLAVSDAFAVVDGGAERGDDTTAGAVGVVGTGGRAVGPEPPPVVDAAGAVDSGGWAAGGRGGGAAGRFATTAEAGRGWSGGASTKISADSPAKPIATAATAYTTSILTGTPRFGVRCREDLNVARTDSAFELSGGRFSSSSDLCRLSASRMVLTDSFRPDAAGYQAPAPARRLDRRPPWRRRPADRSPVSTTST